jgi:hypothetical protein
VRRATISGLLTDRLKTRSAALAAVLAVAAVLAWQAAVVRYVYGGNWTGLFSIGDRLKGPPSLREGAYVFKGSDGYDGQAYRIIAHDPLFQKGYGQFIDDARLRYRRILLPGLAYLLTLGNDRMIDAAYIALIALSIGLGVYWSGRFAQLHGRPAALGFAFLPSVAALVSIDRMLLEGPLAALFMGFAVYTTTGEWRKVYVVSMLAFLTRETGVFLVAGAVLYFCLKKCWRAAAVFSLAALPALAWYVFVWRHTTASHAYEAVLQVPLWGVVRRLSLLPQAPGQPWIQVILQRLDDLALLGFLGCLLLACLWIRRDGPGPVPLTLALFVALGIVLGGRGQPVDAYGYARSVSPLAAYLLVRSAVAWNWRAALPPLALSVGIALFYISPLWRVLRGLAGSVF